MLAQVDLVGEDLRVLADDEKSLPPIDVYKRQVMISPTAQPPVCKIMDYGKYRFEQSKRDKEAKKKQKIVEIKEVRMSCLLYTSRCV